MKLLTVLLAALLFVSCGEESEESKKNRRPLKLSIKPLGASDSHSAHFAKQALGIMSATSTSDKLVIDGLKVTFQNSIDFCKGEYGPGADCSHTLYRFSSPKEVDLAQDVNKQFSIDASTTLEPGVYTHACINIHHEAAVKAHYIDENQVIYTSATGVITSTTLGDDYDYLPLDNIYKNLTPGHGYQETTYFNEPFVYDGSALDLKVHVDLFQAGKFVEYDKEWENHYLNIFMSFNEEATVETYSLTRGGSGKAYLTLVLNSQGELIGGRTRDDSIGIEQFLKDWSCDAFGNCSFTVHRSYGKDDSEVPVQHATGFKREASGSFTLDSPRDESDEATISYSRITR